SPPAVTSMSPAKPRRSTVTSTSIDAPCRTNALSGAADRAKSPPPPPPSGPSSSCFTLPQPNAAMASSHAIPLMNEGYTAALGHRALNRAPHAGNLFPTGVFPSRCYLKGMSLPRFLFVAAALVPGAGCMGNQSGDTAASQTGDLSNPLAERRAPDEELVDACGDGGPILGFEL